MKMIICVSGAAVAALLTWQQSAFLLPPPSLTRLGETAWRNAFLLSQSEGRGRPPHIPPNHVLSEQLLWTVYSSRYFWLFSVSNTEMLRRLKKRVMTVRCRGRHAELSQQAVCESGAPGGPVDGSCWMGAPARWPGSLRTGYKGTGMLLLCVWPPDPVSNVCGGSFETQHIYLRGSEERGRSSCQDGVVLPLTASSALEMQRWQEHNEAASASSGRGTVICGHAENQASCTNKPHPPSSQLQNSQFIFLGVWGNTWELVIALHGCLHVSSCCFYRIL